MATVLDILFLFRVNEIAQRCGVSLKTARRWKAGQIVPPPAAIMLLTRDLGYLHPAWTGWVISLRGELCSPENWVATPGDVLSIQLTQMQLSTYRLENKRLKAELESMQCAGIVEEQPLPDQWEFKAG